MPAQSCFRPPSDAQRRRAGIFLGNVGFSVDIACRGQRESMSELWTCPRPAINGDGRLEVTPLSIADRTQVSILSPLAVCFNQFFYLAVRHVKRRRSSGFKLVHSLNSRDLAPNVLPPLRGQPGSAVVVESCCHYFKERSTIRHLWIGEEHDRLPWRGGRK